MAEDEAATVEVTATVEVSPKEETVNVERKEERAEDTKTKEVKVDTKEPVSPGGQKPTKKEEKNTIEQDVMAENEEKDEAEAESGKQKRKRRKPEPAPVEMHYSKRSRKSAQSFQPENFASPKDTVTIIEGRGTKLADIPNVKEKIESLNNNSEEIIAAHKLIFRANVGKPG